MCCMFAEWIEHCGPGSWPPCRNTTGRECPPASSSRGVVRPRPAAAGGFLPARGPCPWCPPLLRRAADWQELSRALQQVDFDDTPPIVLLPIRKARASHHRAEISVTGHRHVGVALLAARVQGAGLLVHPYLRRAVAEQRFRTQSESGETPPGRIRLLAFPHHLHPGGAAYEASRGR
jgi:hypothetical protein